MKLVHRLADGREYAVDLSREEAEARLREWHRAWMQRGPVAGVVTFADAVVRSDAVVAVEVPGLDGGWLTS